MKIPEHYLPVMPYIIIDKASEFMAFCKKVLGATEQIIVPGVGDRKIMHGELKIFDAVIMFAQTPDNFSERPCGMFIYVEDVKGIYEKAIGEKAIPLMPPSQQEYGFTAGFQDLYGNQWWIVEG